MQPEKSGRLGAAAGAAVIVAMVMLGFHLLTLAPLESSASDGQEEKFLPIVPSDNPEMMADQYKSHDIVRVARSLEPDYKRLQEEYDKLPPFKAPADPRLTPEELDRFLKTYYDAAKEIGDFRQRKIGNNPGIFRILAMVGMIQPFYDVVTLRSQVANGMTEEEFVWVKKVIMQAALYCVQYNLDHEKPSPEDLKRLTDLRDRLYIVTGVREHQEDYSLVDHWDRLRLDQVPRTNIELFLDNYHRINYPKVHFDRPTPVNFDKQAILAAAAGNPP
ncbi:MAG TPA: hypothetical protein VM658_00150 [bacterium]|nr:hypothetical protein [bacterium]